MRTEGARPLTDAVAPLAKRRRRTAEEKAAEQAAIAARPSYTERVRASVDAQQLTTYCGVPGCEWKHEGTAESGRLAAVYHRAEKHQGVARAIPGPREVPMHLSRGRGGRPAEWDDERALRRLREFKDATGEWPLASELGPKRDLPSASVLKRLFGGLEVAVAEAEGRGDVSRSAAPAPAVDVPPAPEPRSAPEPVTAPPAPPLALVTPAAAAEPPRRPSARRGLLLILRGARELVDAYFPEGERGGD